MTRHGDVTKRYRSRKRIYTLFQTSKSCDTVLMKTDKALARIKKVYDIHVNDVDSLRQQYKAICNYIGIEELYKIGTYQIRISTFSTKSFELGSDPKKYFKIGDQIEIIEIKENLKDLRLRGKLKNGNWISLKEMNTGKHFAFPLASNTNFTVNKKENTNFTVNKKEKKIVSKEINIVQMGKNYDGFPGHEFKLEKQKLQKKVNAIEIESKTHKENLKKKITTLERNLQHEKMNYNFEMKQLEKESMDLKNSLQNEKMKNNFETKQLEKESMDLKNEIFNLKKTIQKNGQNQIGENMFLKNEIQKLTEELESEKLNNQELAKQREMEEQKDKLIAIQITSPVGINVRQDAEFPGIRLNSRKNFNEILVTKTPIFVQTGGIEILFFKLIEEEGWIYDFGDEKLLTIIDDSKHNIDLEHSYEIMEMNKWKKMIKNPTRKNDNSPNSSSSFKSKNIL